MSTDLGSSRLVRRVDSATLSRAAVVPAPTGGASALRPAGRRPHPGEAAAAFLASVSVYLGVAVWMLTHNVIFPDSVSRVANAYYVLFSRDPHLPAVGFVWNPLPSVLLLPLIAVKGLFPVLTRDAFAGPIESSIFMAGAVVLVLRLLRTFGVPPRLRRVLTALFALSPLIVIYASSGLSEAMLLFFTLLTCSCLAGWLIDRRPGQLVGTGLALAGAYLTRYEAVAPACGVVLAVLVVTFLSSRGSRRQRLLLALNDVLVVLLPFVVAFAGWALSSRILVGSWFPTFTSDYGNSASVNSARGYIAGGTGTTEAAMAHYTADQLLGLEPFAVVLLILAVIVAIRRRHLAALAIPLVVGAVLAFDDLAFLVGDSYGWLRFQISVIPLTVLLAGVVLARGPQGAVASPAAPSLSAPLSNGPARGQRRRRVTSSAGVVLVTAMVAVSVPVSLFTVTDHRLAREETATLLAAVQPSRALSVDRDHLSIYKTEHRVAAQLDAMHLRDGTVLTESQYAYDIVLASHDPHQFVITSDKEFVGSLADPTDHGIRYLLVPQTAGAPFDALDEHYPGLYRNGGGIATLVRSWTSPVANSNWRLYRVDQ